jgi:hypothetical protein
LISANEVLLDLLRRPRLEVMPLDGAEQEVIGHVPSQLTVTVTSSPTRGIDATLSLCERLAARGYRVVPHLAARVVVDRVRSDALRVRGGLVITPSAATAASGSRRYIGQASTRVGAAGVGSERRMSARKNDPGRGQALRDDAARAAGNKDLSLPPGWHLDKDGFPVKGRGNGDTEERGSIPARARPEGRRSRPARH